MESRDWREIFQVQQAEEPYHVETDPGECNENCLEAKELKCVCRCGGRNHGAHLKKTVQPLDRFNEPQKLEVEVITE
jgi:hypothetical protein